MSGPRAVTTKLSDAMARVEHRILICRYTSATVIVIAIGLAGLASAGAVLASTTGGWNVQPSPNHGRNNGLYGVAATSPTNVWAVGASFPAVLRYQNIGRHWNGTAWGP